jgi:hypothetical protein
LGSRDATPKDHLNRDPIPTSDKHTKVGVLPVIGANFL